MSKTISILNQKGGVGKSNITTLLANVFFFHFGYKVAIIDCDYPQHTIGKKRQRELDVIKRNPILEKAYNQIYKNKSPYPIIPTNLSSFEIALDKLEGDFDFIFFDIKGTMAQENFVPFLKRVNYFFIPVLEEETAIISSLEFYKSLIEKIKPISSNFEYCSLFFNLVPRANNLDKLLPALSKKFNFLNLYIKQYKVYQKEFHSTIFPISTKRIRTKKAEENLFGFAALMQKELKGLTAATI